MKWTITSDDTNDAFPADQIIGPYSLSLFLSDGGITTVYVNRGEEKVLQASIIKGKVTLWPKQILQLSPEELTGLSCVLSELNKVACEQSN